MNSNTLWILAASPLSVALYSHSTHIVLTVYSHSRALRKQCLIRYALTKDIIHIV